MKSQFQSSEAMLVRFPPFVSKTTGDYVSTGADVCTLVLVRPDGSTYPGGPHLATWNATVKMWLFSVAVGAFSKGEWLVYGSSNAADTLPQWRQLFWGDYVDDVTLTAKVLTGRWKIDTALNRLYLYDGDGPTVLKTFALKDENGVGTSTRIFERTLI